MKKGLAMLLSVVMVLAMGMTAFAASPATKPTTITSPTPGVKVEAADEWATSTATAKATEINKNAQLLAVDYVYYDGTFPANGMSIRLDAAGVKKGDNIVILHMVYDEKTGEQYWEQIVPSEVGDGYVVAFFKTLSPVAIVKLPANSSAATTGTSPKTGYWG